MTASANFNPELSVIVPVYNVAPYLRKCLDSILNQTFKNIEIIIVSDGPDEEKSEDRIENAGIVAEDKGIYMPDRNRKR